MEIQQSTKLDVNSFTVNHFTNKGNIGYTYFKLFLEIALEKYRQVGYIPNLKLAELIKLANIDVSVQAVQRAIQYFFAAENINYSTADAIIIYTEQIIEQSKIRLIEGDEF